MSLQVRPGIAADIRSSGCQASKSLGCRSPSRVLREHVDLRNTQNGPSMSVRICACTYIYIYIYISVHICIHVSMYLYIHACMHICLYTVICTSHVCMCMYTHSPGMTAIILGTLQVQVLPRSSQEHYSTYLGGPR